MAQLRTFLDTVAPNLTHLKLTLAAYYPPWIAMVLWLFQHLIFGELLKLCLLLLPLILVVLLPLVAHVM